MNFQPGTVICVARSMTARVMETVTDQSMSALPKTEGIFSFATQLLFGASIASPDLSKLARLERYRHYGVYAGRGQVIHFTGSAPSTARIRLTSVGEFEEGTFLDSVAGEMLGIHTDDQVEFPEGKAAAVCRARSMLGSDFGGYHLLRNNCEHFANWCACRKKISRQLLNKGLELIMPATPPIGILWLGIVRGTIMR
ncbi:MAG TPA: lecithin retinol acyltransferase family protein [Candidatus Ozemobacteraceae bacterium]|nr:lecithin retinol acyltransferase family protein [Candidatus Ozemobacteraceae bacterium]